MKPEIVWTRGAEDDLLLLYRHLEAITDDDELPLRLLRRPLQDSLDLLEQNPLLGRCITKEGRLRRLLIGDHFRYGLFYTVEARGVIIHALLDLRQDPDLIRRRLKNI